MTGKKGNLSNMSDLSYSIIIRAFNEEKHIGRLFEGISQQSNEKYEIILVDSGSTDGTREIAAGFNAKILQIQPEEFTFGRSLNLGIANARGDIVVIASAHVYPVYPDWLERLLAPFDDERVALTYGKQRGNNSTHFSENQVFAHWYPDRSQTNQTHPFCNNANAAIRRSLWEKRNYDENLSGLEDIDWGNWALNEGYRISYVAEAEVVHVHNETRTEVFNRYRREAMAFKRIFPQERFHLIDFLRLTTTNIINDARQAALNGVLSESLGGIVWFRWMQFWGTYQGYRHSGPFTWQLRRTFYYPKDMRYRKPRHEREVAPIQYNEPDIPSGEF